MDIRRFLKAASVRTAGAVVLAILLGCSAVAPGGGAVAAPSARLAAFLGADAVAVLQGADRIEPFALETALMPPGGSGPDFIDGYRWKARGADLPPAAVAGFVHLALSDSSYDFAGAKKCPMVPEYALRVHAGPRTLDVLISFSCRTWAFGGDPESRVEDFDAVEAQLKAIIETVFRMQ